MSTCKQWREGDEMVCTCGLRWDTKEEDPHTYTSESEPYKLAPILEAKRLYNPLFKNIVANSQVEGDSYTEMLEKALFLHIEKTEDAERNLLKYVTRFGPGILNEGNIKKLRKRLNDEN